MAPKIPGISHRSPPASRYFRWLVIAAAGILLLIVSQLTPSSRLQPWPGLLVLLFVAFQVNYPLRLLQSEISLAHIIALGSGLAYGASTAAWAATLGVLLGSLLYRWRMSRQNLAAPGWMGIVFRAGLLDLALILALFVAGREAGQVADQTALTGSGDWLELLPAVLLFAGLHGSLILVDFIFRRTEAWAPLRKDLYALSLLEFLPLPFVLIALLAFAAIGPGALVLLGGVPAIVSVLLSSMSRARSDLERRLQELSTLDQVSRVLSSSLDLEKLLSVMHIQVSRLLGVDNFYVALLDKENDRIWYPLAVKHGQRQLWAPRPLADRLTDRVIRQGQPILLSPRHTQDVHSIDLPPSEDTPTAWLGVPLFASGRASGCLALFSLTPGAEFTPADRDLLGILSGQASVAIENALLYEQAQRRAAQLETLNRISSLITASLDPQEVLAQVCRSVTLVAGAHRSAIFLLSPEENRVWLAHTHKLSDRFKSQNETFSITNSRRARCLRARRPILVPDLQEASMDREFWMTLQEEGIYALGDFPLVTPDGEIGFLSVYFEAAHRFHPDEVELLQTFASQAALAVSNARLYARTDLALSQRLQQLSILEAVGRELAAAIHSEQLFEMILTYARDFTNSPWGCIGLYDPNTQKVEIQASSGYQQVKGSFPVEAGVSGRAIRAQQAIISSDVRQDPDYLDLTGGAARSQISVPLIHEGSVLGVLTLESPQKDSYTRSDQAFISQLANQAAIAVVNARLYADVMHGRDRLATVLDSVNEGILLIGAGGYILLANQAIQRLTGLAPVELIGHTVAALSTQALSCFGYTREEASQLVETLGQEQPPPGSPATLKTGEGSREHILERISLPVWGSHGRATGFLVVLRDVTGEHRIAQARELITETLVHDLRSPLSAVLGSLDLISEDLSRIGSLDETVAQAMQVAHSGARRILDMVESLLDISRMQSGSVELSREEVDLHSLIASVLAEISAQAGEFGIRLHHSVPPGLPKVCADRAKLERILSNLLDNAVKFTPSGGRVVITAELKQADMLEVKISDSGPGIPEEYREKIFDRFTQIPGQRGRRRGSGLGLTFCRLAVEAHGGHIWVEEQPDGGSLFAFTLPVQSPETKPRSAPESKTTNFPKPCS